jgi:hypothetical protein
VLILSKKFSLLGSAGVKTLAHVTDVVYVFAPHFMGLLYVLPALSVCIANESTVTELGNAC